MSDKIKLAPGTYRLTQTVKNPEADRRHRYDWRLDAEFTEGTVFVVEENHDFDYPHDASLTPEQNAKIQIALQSHKMMMLGARFNNRIYDHSELWQVIAPHLINIEETPDALLVRLHADDDMHFRRFLIKKLGPEAFEKLWLEYRDYTESD